jgi:hypothetical protein
MSCQARKDNGNVVLTDFTKELVSMYIDDLDNLEAKNRKDEIIIISVTDTLYYRFSVFSNDNKTYKYCRKDFVGQILYLRHLIRVFGNENSIFYSVQDTIKPQKRCNDDFIENDPSVWQVCFHKDMSFCKMRTYKVTNNKDISAIQSLAEKYFKVSDAVNEIHENEVFQWHEIENSSNFSLGEDSLRHLISSNFKIKREDVQGKIPIVVDIVVDTNGKATLKGITKSSNDIELDNEALRVAEMLCQYKFIPASHRGEKVNTIYPIAFLRKDIVFSLP